MPKELCYRRSWLHRIYFPSDFADPLVFRQYIVPDKDANFGRTLYDLPVAVICMCYQRQISIGVALGALVLERAFEEL